jgi:hypothetical protein
MAKIGRNEKCPCRSGKKYKHCCAGLAPAVKPQVSPDEKLKLTLMSSVREIQDQAIQRKKTNSELGVFFFYSTEEGDAWVLEMTGCDSVQVARDGEALEPPIDEDPETIEVNWTHMFDFRNKQLEFTAYSDKSVQLMSDAPSREISAAMRRIRKKFSKEQLSKVHLPSPDKPE